MTFLVIEIIFNRAAQLLNFDPHTLNQFSVDFCFVLFDLFRKLHRVPKSLHTPYCAALRVWISGSQASWTRFRTGNRMSDWVSIFLKFHYCLLGLKLIFTYHELVSIHNNLSEMTVEVLYMDFLKYVNIIPWVIEAPETRI